MLTWLMENMATIVISLILLFMVAAAIVSMARSKRKGKSSCGCGCANCPAGSCCAMNGARHPTKSDVPRN